MVVEICTLGNYLLVFDGPGTLVNCELVFGGFDTFISRAVFAGVFSCPNISSNIESASS